MANRGLAGWALGALALLVTLAASFGLPSRRVLLNFGPGDSPFVRGFEANSDVENKVGWHWTTYDAAIGLPFTAAGADVDMTLRYARMFGEEAVVDVSVGGAPMETFRARGGEVRDTTLSAAAFTGPTTVFIKVDSHERRNMGLRLDRLTLDVRSGASLRLQPVAALRPALVALLLFAGLWLLGASPLAAGVLTLLAASGFTARASEDLFGAWRQTQYAPTMLVISFLVLRLGRYLLERFVRMGRTEAGWLASAAFFTMFLRLTLVSHPDFYYPDLLTHARVVEAIRLEGPGFFLDPAEALNAQRAWTKPVLGGVSSLPYAVLFHTPFAILSAVFALSLDQIEGALKAVSSLISVLPILLAGALATRLSLPPLAAIALCVIPTYTSRLSFALLPALFGHVFDLIVLLALATIMVGERLESNRSTVWLFGCLLLGHLAYTSSVVNEGLLMAVLVILSLFQGRGALESAGRLVLAEAFAGLLAFLLYYRHFVGDVLGLGARLIGVSGAGGGEAAQSVYPIESFWGLLFERTDTFFGWPYVGLALAGLVMGGETVRRSVVTRAVIVTYLALIFLRAKIPDVFRYGHETLFLTPLVAMLAGAALIFGWSRGGRVRWASLAAGLALGLVSFWRQWLAVAEQMANAL